ncbi:Ubiquinone biosynthesis protein coq9, mitochondrial [Myotisia sp. PD_48]|nr:Ubiquinone biosynthesis protein coq9, mitochondrial [Myotisia sp. PD_48]
MVRAAYHVTDDEHGPWVVVISGLFMTYTVLCYLARLLMRFTINGPFGSDDWAVTIGTVIAVIQAALKIKEGYTGLGKHANVVPLQDIRQIEKLAFVSDIFYLIGMTLSRLATLLLIRRLTQQKNHHFATNIGMAIAGVAGIVSIFVLSIRCDLSRPWNLVDPGCTQMYARWYSIETIGILVELYTAWVPIYLVWGLQMRLKSKLVVLFAFSFRLPVIILAGARIHFLREQQSMGDPIFYGAASATFLELELHYALMAATIPCLKPFVKAFNTGYFDTSAALQGSSAGEGYALSNITNARTKVTVDESIYKKDKRTDRKGHQRDGSDTPSSAGSDKMIIRRTTAWDVSYDTGDRTYHSGSSSFSPLSPSSSPSSQFSPEQLSILSTAVSRHVPELGFTREALAQAAQDVGYLDVSLHLFPHGGEIELVLYWLSSRRALLKERAESGEVFGGTAEADCIGVDEKVKMLIIDRLKMNSDLVHHWQDALAIMSLPSNIPSSLTELYELSSDILYLAGDRSVDSSWYSRRLAVSTVYASAEIFMTEDASTDFASTQEFVDRRVKDSRAISGVLGDVKTYLGYVAGSLVAAGRSWGMKV